MHNCALIRQQTSMVPLQLVLEKEAEASACTLNPPHFHLLGPSLLTRKTAHALPAPMQAQSVQTLQLALVQLGAVVSREHARAQPLVNLDLVPQPMIVQGRAPLQLRTRPALPKRRVRQCPQAQSGRQSPERSL
jgi:hypothetical protein